MPGYLDYMDLIYQKNPDGMSLEEAQAARKKRYAENGITTKDFDWHNEIFEGYATVWFKDNKPFHVAAYTWNSKYSGALEDSLELSLGYPLKYSNWSGGNGHDSFNVEPVESTNES